MDVISANSDLSPAECWARLRKENVGRLGVLLDDGPDICPVNFVVDGSTVVFRSGPGSKLAAVSRGGPVAFEVDHHDPEAGAAWSVVLRGRADLVTETYALIDTTSLPLFPWHAAPKGAFVRVTPTTITGRHFVLADPSRWDTPFTGLTRTATD